MSPATSPFTRPLFQPFSPRTVSQKESTLEPLTSRIYKSNTPIHSVAVHPQLPTHSSPAHLSFTLSQDLRGLERFICSHSAPLRPKTTLSCLSFLPAVSTHTIDPLNQSPAYPLGSFPPLGILLHQLSKTTTQICPDADFPHSKPGLLSCATGNHPSWRLHIRGLQLLLGPQPCLARL